jgi:hypothetical protein
VTASSEEDSEEEEEDGGNGHLSGGLSVGGTWQRQEDVLRRMHQQRNDILVCVCTSRCVSVSVCVADACDRILKSVIYSDVIK